MILLTPGPCMTSETVRQAAALPDLNHREPEYLEIVRDTKRRLMGVYPQTEGWVPYLLGGSGTAAVEAMVASCICEGPVLLVENGYYSARIKDILDVYRIPYDRFTLGWQESWSREVLDRLCQKLETNHYEALLSTHNETTLGRLNPIEKIAERCRQCKVRVLIDAMSSFGADPIDFTNLDAVVSSANKCLHALPGLSFVLANPQFASDIRQNPRRSYYLSLPMLEGDEPPVTPPVPALRALRQALVENPDGQAVRFQEYQEKIAHIRRGLSHFAVPEIESSSTLACPALPSGWTFDGWYRANHDRGYAIYGCKGDLRERYYQVSVMGEVTIADIDRWLSVAADLVQHSQPVN